MTNDTPWQAPDSFDDEPDSSRDSFGDEDRYRNSFDDDFREKPPKSGCSGNMKVLLIVLTIVSGLCLTCCCGIGYFIVQVMPNEIEDPIEIDALRTEIVEIELPEEMEPKMGITMGWEGLFGVKFAAYSTNDGSIKFHLGKLEFSSVDMQDLDFDFNDEIEDEMPSFESKTTETKTLTIQGKEHEFQLVKGKEKGTGKQTIILTGTVPIKTNEGVRQVIINIISTDEKFGEEEAIKMIEEMKIKE